MRTLALAAMLATAHAISIPTYFRRDNICGGRPEQKLTQCQDGLDTGLCCPEGSTCLYLAGGSTVLCCPANVCQRIKPITCNIEAQNPERFPGAPIKTTALRAALPRCRGNCCPFGFTCNADGQCDMDEDQSQRPRDLPESEQPSITAIPSSAIATPTVVPTTILFPTTASPSSTGSPTSEEQQDDVASDKKDDPLPTAIIVVSVLGGILVLVSVAVGVVMFLARRKRKGGNEPGPHNSSEKKHSGVGLCRPSTSTSSFGNFISEPILNQGPPVRSDFILKSPASAATRTSGRLSTLFRKDGASYGGTTANNSPAEPSITKTAERALRSPPRFPVRSLSNATMTTKDKHPGLTVPPIRTLRSQQKPKISTGDAWTRHAAAARAAVPDTATPVTARPVTPHLQREPSSESINIFADPSTVGSSGGVGPFHLEPPRAKRFTAGTTFTDLMDQAELGDVRRGKAFVPTPRR